MKNTQNTLPPILLKKVIHKNKIQLLLLFPYNNEIKNILYNLGGYYWSKTLRGWHTQFTLENITLLKQTLNDKVTFKLDPSVYEKLKVKPIIKTREISEQNKQIIRLYVKYLEGKCYSESTIKTYFSFIADFFDYLKDTSISTISNQTIELFIKDVFVPRNYSVSTYRQFMIAIKLFKTFYPECDFNDLQLKRTEKSILVPTIISKEEIETPLDLALKNLMETNDNQTNNRLSGNY